MNRGIENTWCSIRLLARSITCSKKRRRMFAPRLVSLLLAHSCPAASSRCRSACDPERPLKWLENHLPALSGVHVFANQFDPLSRKDKSEAIVILVGLASRKSGSHPLLDDHSITIGMNAPKRDVDVREQMMHFRGNKVCDLVRSNHVVGVLESDRRGISGRCDPFGIGSKQLGDQPRITGFKSLPGIDHNLFRIRAVHFLLLLVLSESGPSL